jgi:hypothetical protein
MSIISIRRARSRSSCSGRGVLGFILRLEIAGFRPQQYQTLHPEPKKNDALSRKISGIRVVQVERIKEDVKTQHEILNCKDAADLNKIQMRFVQTAIDDYTAESGKLIEMYQEILQSSTKNRS